MDISAFFARVRVSLFSGALTQGQVEGLERLLAEAARIGLTDAGQLAYILATSYHETGRRMQPVREAYAGSDAAAVAMLESAWTRGKLPWVKAPYWLPDADGKAWFGRGDVQLTHRTNYERMGDLIGVDLVGDPSLALDPAISARILFEGMLKGASGRGDFTSYVLDAFVLGNKLDFTGARRVVNGTDRAADIAGYAERFLAALRAAGWTGRADDPPPAAEPPEPEPVAGDVLAALRAHAASLDAVARAAGIDPAELR